jgi:hypothetical protein
MPVIELPDWVAPLIGESCDLEDAQEVARYLTMLVVVDYRRTIAARSGKRVLDHRLKALLDRSQGLCGMVLASSWSLGTIATHPHEFLSWVEERRMPVCVLAAEKKPLIVQTPLQFREMVRWIELARHYLRFPGAAA